MSAQTASRRFWMHHSQLKLISKPCSTLNNPLQNSRIRALSSSTAIPSNSNVLIVGGGVVGSALCDLISQHMPDWTVGLLDAAPKPKNSSVENNKIPHPRSYALSPASLELLDLTNHSNTATSSQSPLSLGRYQRMQVWEAQQPAYVSFGVEDLEESSSRDESLLLGATVGDAALVQHLQARWQDRPNVWTRHGTRITSLQVPEQTAQGLVQVQLAATTDETNTKNQPTTVSTQLLLAADGANSFVRQQLGIPYAGWDYGQTALTFTVELSSPMQGTAFQRFLSTGPIALLPTHSEQHAVVVWSTTPQQAQHWKTQPPLELAQHVNRLLQQGPERLEPLLPPLPSSNDTVLGNLLYGVEKVIETLQYGPAMAAAAAGTPPQADDVSNNSSNNNNKSNNALFVVPPTCTTVASPCFTFPLTCRQVHQYTAPRVALVGDAAHTVHPMAGQGLNLGLDDVAALISILQKTHQAGMDPATFLDQYQRGRHGPVTATVQGIHALHAVFGNRQAWMQHGKSVGMNLVQTVAPLRRWLVQAACQGVVAGPAVTDGTARNL